MPEILLEGHKKKSFLHWIVTGDKKWIHYAKYQGKKIIYETRPTSQITAKPNIHGANVMVSVWWDQKAVLYCELPKPGENIIGERYRTQLICLKRAIAEKRPEYATRHKAIIFHI